MGPAVFKTVEAAKVAWWVRFPSASAGAMSGQLVGPAVLAVLHEPALGEPQARLVLIIGVVLLVLMTTIVLARRLRQGSSRLPGW